MKKFISGLSDSDEPLLNYFVDPNTGEFLYPVLFDTGGEFNQSLSLFYNSGDSSNANYEIRVCMIDSGLLTEHPLFQGRVIDAIDFTGEGIEDRNGHGTMVSFLWLARNPVGDRAVSVKFLVAKVLDKKIRGTEEALISAMEWAVEKKADIINISAGFDRQIWFYNPCKGTCKICKAAEKAANSVFALHAAAGNSGRTVCPARSGVYNPKSKVVAMGSKNSVTGVKEKWSGKGTRYTSGTVQFQSIKKTDSNEARLGLIEKMMSKLWERKEYEKAMSLLIQLRDGMYQVEATDEQINLVRDKFCRLRSLIADKYFNEGNYEKALNFHLDSLKDFEVVEGHRENALFGTHLSIGICYVETGNYDLALENLLKSQEIYSQGQIPYRDYRLYYIHEYLGICYLHMRQSKEALENFELALEYSKEFYPDTDFYMHNCLLNIASAKVSLGEMKIASQLLEIISDNQELFMSARRLELFEDLKQKISKNE